MNSLETALHEQLKRMLIAEQAPSGRPLTDAEWWAMHGVDAVLTGAVPWHPDRRSAGRDNPRPRLAGPDRQAIGS